MKYEVDSQFIREAYKDACSEWKERIKAKFPQVFDIEKQVSELKEYEEFKNVSFGIDSLILVNDLILIELPKSNSTWSKAAFKLATKLIEERIAYPEHAGYREGFISRNNDISFKQGNISNRHEVDFILMKIN
jgi:hypothetical protein